MSEQNACFTVNRKKGYFHVYNINASFPLVQIQALKANKQMTYQEVANYLKTNYNKQMELQL